MSGNGPRYDWSAAATAEICNLYLNSSLPKADVYARIVYTILNAMYRAEEELRALRLEPSDN